MKPTKCIYKFINLYISRIHHRKHHSNFTKEEHQALDHLKNNEDILIKKADKGGAVVVWRKDLYIAEGERQLNDVESYQVLNSDNTDENNRIVDLSKQKLTKIGYKMKLKF